MIPRGFFRNRWYLFNRTLFCWTCNDWIMHWWDDEQGAYLCENRSNHNETLFQLQAETTRAQIDIVPDLPAQQIQLRQTASESNRT